MEDQPIMKFTVSGSPIDTTNYFPRQLEEEHVPATAVSQVEFLIVVPPARPGSSIKHNINWSQGKISYENMFLSLHSYGLDLWRTFACAPPPGKQQATNKSAHFGKYMAMCTGLRSTGGVGRDKNCSSWETGDKFFQGKCQKKKKGHKHPYL